MSSTHKRTGKKWSKAETILAFELYCRTPFGKIHAHNQDILDLAELLGRSPGSVALKMSNLAHYDPVLRARNIAGMAHSSKLDGEVFEEFYQSLEELAHQAWFIKRNMGVHDFEEAPELADIDAIPPGEYREQLLRVRMGQYSFRMSILNSYHQRCCITGLAVPKLLIASHIKPWAACEERTERTNPRNGLCLNSFHDKAFDQGFLTIDKNYRIIISSQLHDAEMDDLTKTWFMGYGGKTIALPDKFVPSKEFIEYHNDMIFRP